MDDNINEDSQGGTATATLPPPSDTIELEGRIKSGNGFYPARLRLALHGDDLTNPEFSATLPALLSNLGIDPVTETAPAASGGGGGAARPTATGTSGGAGGRGCPVHGVTYERPGFRNQGYECKAFAPNQEEWTQPKAWTSGDGTETRWYCKSKWK